MKMRQNLLCCISREIVRLQMPVVEEGSWLGFPRKKAQGQQGLDGGVRPVTVAVKGHHHMVLHQLVNMEAAAVVAAAGTHQAKVTDPCHLSPRKRVMGV